MGLDGDGAGRELSIWGAGLVFSLALGQGLLELHLLSRLLNLVMRVVDLGHPREWLVKRLAELNVGADGPGSRGPQRGREIHIRRAVDEESPWARGG